MLAAPEQIVCSDRFYSAAHVGRSKSRSNDQAYEYKCSCLVCKSLGGSRGRSSSEGSQRHLVEPTGHGLQWQVPFISRSPVP